MLKFMQKTFIAIGALVAVTPAIAQQPSASRPAVPMFSTSDNAHFMRVDDGMFEIQVGRTIDLTDKKLTFMLRAIENIETPERSLSRVMITGNHYDISMAGRLNLKNAFSNELRDYRNCWLDLIRVTDARGAPPSATFRMECR